MTTLRRPGRRTALVAVLTAAVATLGPLPAQATPPVPLTTTSSANDRIARVLPIRLQDPVLGGDVAVDVFDLATDRHVFTRRSTAPYRVASNTKLVTAATALETMGPSRKFPTTVVLGRGGRVYLVGGGDPLLSSATLRSLATRTAAALRARDQSRVSVLLDDTLFAPWAFPAGFANRCSANHLTRGYCITPVRALTVDRRSGDDNARDAARSFARALNSAAGVVADYRGRATAPRTRLGAGGPTGAADPVQLARY
ncbi:MAG TPA: D-alanyl-D-alanine carboxypeptidase, partial [Candidatus Limnocylindria bacterium]|nr:D-alanyl-D-alanine carboxypeptidase [Candidatus Limnocylindria bacterium]